MRALERAFSLDPQNPAIKYHLGIAYRALLRFREAEELGLVDHSYIEFLRTGDLKKFRAKLRAEQDRQPASTSYARSDRFWSALGARDWTAASQILAKNPDEDLYNGTFVKVAIPRGCGEIWLAALQGKHPTLEGRFKSAREELAQRVEAHPEEVELLSVLGVIDAFLGRKQEAIEEATRAVELRPMSQDAEEGHEILGSLALVYTWTNEPDQAFEKLAIMIKTPPLVDSRVAFEADPENDPIRKDPRFAKLVAQIPTYP